MNKPLSAGQAILNNPANTQVVCKACGLMLKGGADIINHLDVHNKAVK